MAAPQTSRLLNLDILRLLSALLVLGFHYAFRMRITGQGGGIGFPEFAPAAMWFDTGLLIFFAISGYVITLSAENRTAYDFAAGRVARLWPTFFLCATITALVMTNWAVPGLPAPTITQWLAHTVIISRGLGQPFLDGAYWTIAYEVIFYGWVFIMISAGWFQKYWRAIAVSWLSLSLANEFAIDSDAIRNLFITSYSGYFIFGMTLFRLRQNVTLGALCILAAAALWATATPFLVEPAFFGNYGIHRSAIGLALIGPIALTCVCLCALAPSMPVRPAIATGLGSLTYPLYLLHQNIGYAVFTRFGQANSRWLVGALLFAGLILVSWGIATYVEPPARRWIILFSRRLARDKSLLQQAKS